MPVEDAFDGRRLRKSSGRARISWWSLAVAAAACAPAAALSPQAKSRMLTDAATMAKAYVDNAVKRLGGENFGAAMDDQEEVRNTFRQIQVIMPKLDVKFSHSDRDEWPGMCGRPYTNLWSQGLRLIYVCNRAFKMSTTELARSLVHEMTHNTDPRYLRAEFGKETPVFVRSPDHWKDECFAARMEVTAAALSEETPTSYYYTQRCKLDGYGRRLLHLAKTRR
jgi:hypothetical protein